MQEGRKHLKKYANNISAISRRSVSVCFCAIEKEMNGRQKKLNHLQQLGLLWLPTQWMGLNG